MATLKEVSAMLSVEAYNRLEAYLPFIARDGENRQAVCDQIIAFAEAKGQQITQNQFDDWVRRRGGLNLPSWVKVEVDSHNRPLVLKCHSCNRHGVSLTGNGYLLGVQVCGNLVHGGKAFFCIDCRRFFGRSVNYVGHHEANEMIRTARNTERERRRAAHNRAFRKSSAAA